MLNGTSILDYWEPVRLRRACALSFELPPRSITSIPEHERRPEPHSSKISSKIKQTTSDFLYDSSSGAKTPFQYAVTHNDVGQSEEELCYAA